MKNLILLTVLLSVSIGAEAQADKAPEMQIRKYWFVMLTRGANRTQDSVTAARLQQGHMDNMQDMYYEGKLKVAGPFGDDGNWRGIFIFDCETKEEVEKLLAKDPAITSGRLAYEIHPWYTEPSGNFKPGKPERKQ